ncbi:FAD-binding oxidoreductase [soil metagenome]
MPRWRRNMASTPSSRDPAGAGNRRSNGFRQNEFALAEVYTPMSEQELSNVLAAASAEHKSVTPWGGGTHQGLGNVPSRIDWLIGMQKLEQTLAYEPADMTLSVQAGKTLSAVQDLLAEHGQALPIEVSQPDSSTIGGILASALYGPKRLGAGTLRDYLIGITVAYPGGAIAKAGGMVVKNVSGFDLMRMHHGALGTLGVIVSANFKVLPRPRSERTVRWTQSDETMLARSVELLMTSRVRPGALEIEVIDGGFRGYARLEGRDRIVELLAEEAGSLLSTGFDILDQKESQRFWRDFAASFETDFDAQTVWIRVRLKPSETIPSLLDLLRVERVIPVRMSFSPGLGYVDLRLSAEALESAAAFSGFLNELRDMVPRAIAMAAPAFLKQDVDVWGDSVESLDLMTTLKREFDPENILNPGRYVGRL